MIRWLAKLDPGDWLELLALALLVGGIAVAFGLWPALLATGVAVGYLSQTWTFEVAPVATMCSARSDAFEACPNEATRQEAIRIQGWGVVVPLCAEHGAVLASRRTP